MSIRPDEVAAVLREQLADLKTASELEEVGTVLQVGDGVARIYGLTEVQAGELIEFENGRQALALNLEEDNVGAVVLGAVNDGNACKFRSYAIAVPDLINCYAMGFRGI